MLIVGVSIVLFFVAMIWMEKTLERRRDIAGTTIVDNLSTYETCDLRLPSIHNI